MRRHFSGLQQTDSADELPDGIFLVRVQKAEYRWHAQKPYYTLRLGVLEPNEMAGRIISGRLYCAPKAMWKLGWFFYVTFSTNPELFGREEVDEKAMLGLCGIVKISHTTLNGISLLNFDGFAPASQWEELSSSSTRNSGSQVAS
jgi:hypothetical protein